MFYMKHGGKEMTEYMSKHDRMKIKLSGTTRSDDK